MNRNTIHAQQNSTEPSSKNAQQQQEQSHKKLDSHKAEQTLQNLLRRANACNTAVDVKQSKAADGAAVPGGLAALTSLSVTECIAMKNNTREDSTVSSGSKPSLHAEDVTPKEQPSGLVAVLALENLEAEISDSGMDANKLAIPGKWTKFVKKKDEGATKRDLAAAGLGKYTRRDSHMDSSRGKEYKQSRYVDSPPESPPCGWTSCIDDRDANEENPFSERVFEGLSLFSKPGELDDTVGIIGQTDPGPAAASGSLSSRSQRSTKDDQSAEAYLQTREAKFSLVPTPENRPSERYIHEFVNGTLADVCKLKEEWPRPVGVAHEKFDLGNDDNFVHRDLEFATMSDEDFSDGGQSWSSGSFQGRQGDGEPLTSFPESSSFLNDEASKNTWNLGNDNTNEDLHGISLCSYFIDWFPPLVTGRG